MREVVNISQHLANEGSPVWSPEGQLAWMSDRESQDESDDDIYVWHSLTDEIVNLSQEPGFDSSLAWSPDGKLAWMSDRTNSSAIYVWDSSRGDVIGFIQNSADEFVWSDDGQLAWQSDRGGNREIDIWDSHSAEVINVSQNRAADNTPVWLNGW